MIIAVDFDGTCVTHEFPSIGKDIGAVPVLKELINNGHKLILLTMRSHKIVKENSVPIDTLQDAIDWFKRNKIPLYGINKNPNQERWTSSPKVYANIYIDDAALGTPLKYDKDGASSRPYVDWDRMRTLLKIKGVL